MPWNQIVIRDIIKPTSACPFTWNLMRHHINSVQQPKNPFSKLMNQMLKTSNIHLASNAKLKIFCLKLYFYNTNPIFDAKSFLMA